MKKDIKLLLVSFLSLFATTTVVKAATPVTVNVGDAVTKEIELYNGSNRYTPDGLYVNSSNKEFYVIGYRAIYNNQKYIAYCLDPNGGAVNSLKIDRILGDSSSTNVKVYDSGLKTILYKGYREGQTSYTFNDNGNS